MKFFLSCAAALAIFSCQPQGIGEATDEPEKTDQTDGKKDDPDGNGDGNGSGTGDNNGDSNGDNPGGGKVDGVKAAYEDFIGRWIVTGTEHQWFMDEGETPATYSYSIQIEAAAEENTYTVKNWETGYKDEDRAHLYYGTTEAKSIYDYLIGIGVNADISAWYDPEEGRMHIDRQTLYNTGSKTVEFLADHVDETGHTSIGSFNTTPGDADREYTICDFVMQADGSVVIAAHQYPIAFMGYARYEGFLWSMHFNAKFAFPYSMVPNTDPLPKEPEGVRLAKGELYILTGASEEQYALIQPGDAVIGPEDLIWTADDPSIVSIALKDPDNPTEVIVTGLKEGETTITCTLKNGESDHCSVTVSVPKENGHEYVDLGLPSGIMWATMNIGAESPTKSGYFFAWGETEPKEKKDDFKNSTYKFYTLVESAFKITKYCGDSSDGYKDDKVTLEPEDDAAHVLWGGRWRMPTRQEVVELLEYTKDNWYYDSAGGKHFNVYNADKTRFIALPHDNLNSGDAAYYHSSSIMWWEVDQKLDWWNSAALLLQWDKLPKAQYYYQNRHLWGMIRPVFDPKDPEE